MTKNKAVVRFGSVTELKSDVEVNSVESIKNSSSKLKMKKCFDNAGVHTAKWGQANNLEDLLKLANSLTNEWKNYLVCKSLFGSRGNGNTLIKSVDELEIWAINKNLENYIFEKFYNYTREYRLHITEEGCFYTCRKLLKEDTPNDRRWYRNDSNSVWVVEENASFNKPSNWNLIIEDCVKALKSIGADVLSFDVKVSKDEDFILIECNSASSFGKITLEKYKEEIPKIINRKLEKRGA